MNWWGMYRSLVLVLLIAVTSGCSRGFIYTDITSPLVKNLTRSSIGTKTGKTGTKEFRIPLGRGNLSAAWSSRAIGDAMKQGGLTTVYLADERVVSILGGVWLKRTVTVYGD